MIIKKIRWEYWGLISVVIIIISFFIYAILNELIIMGIGIFLGCLMLGFLSISYDLNYRENIDESTYREAIGFLILMLLSSLLLFMFVFFPDFKLVEFIIFISLWCFTILYGYPKIYYYRKNQSK